MEAQTRLGLLYLTGNGIPQNYVMGYVWLSLGISNGSDADNIIKMRDYLVFELLSSSQLAEGQKIVADIREKIIDLRKRKGPLPPRLEPMFMSN